ncbi:hypothetical protein [Bilophila wadsworthia]|uniref:hypothetical protein n=1 Tax=Bilophila wadsworthia TaxID=35833 RepID=UPI00266520A9|nr:hypothetical protein [Bilophila wadsworthia]
MATGRVKKMNAGFASTWGVTPAIHTKQHTFVTCTISVWLHAGYATTLKQIYRGNEPMTAQEWLDELERLRKAAIMPPYYLRKKLFFGEDEEEYYITDKEERIICRMKYMSTEPDNAAYIVAACNAVPRLVEMLVFLASLASEDDESVDAIERRIQWAYNETRPKE